MVKTGQKSQNILLNFMSTTFFANILLNFGQIRQPVPKWIRNRFSVPEKSPKNPVLGSGSESGFNPYKTPYFYLKTP